jgi:hypothetical protein
MTGRFYHPTFLFLSPFYSVCVIILIMPDIKHDCSVAKKPLHSDGCMSIASLLCDPANAWDQHPQPYSRNRLKSLENAHSLVSIRSKSKSDSIGTQYNSSGRQDQEDIWSLDPPVFSSSRYKQTSTIHGINKDSSKPHKRAHRPRYKDEEIDFVWYMRDCRARNWRDILDSFNHQFPDRRRHSLQSIQCMLYRFKKEQGLPSLRKQRRFHEGQKIDQHLANRRNRDATMSGMNVRYSWMLEAPRKGCPPSENSDDGGV